MADINLIRHAVLRTEYAAMKRECLAFGLLLEHWLDLSLKRYNPDQPRVPAGQTGGGQWAAGELVLAGTIVPICIPTGTARFTDEYGNKSWTAIFECFDGRTFRRSGTGNGPRGVVLQ